MSFFKKTDDQQSPNEGRTVMIPSKATENDTNLMAPDTTSTKPISGFEDKTEVAMPSALFGSPEFTMEDEPAIAAQDDELPDEGVTRVIGGMGGIKQASSGTDDSTNNAVSGEHPKGPVTGWLVVTCGPEVGESFSLRHGPQVIARGEGADVALKDPSVSRDKQATVHYDPNMAEFSLYRGQATPNMYTSRDGKMSSLHVGTNHILQLGDEIVFGDSLSTRLRFVPLCGENFSWRDVEK
jgi:hypothetical protein